MNPPHDPEKLIRYLFGELEPLDCFHLERHLSRCEGCRDFLDFARSFRSWWAAADARGRIQVEAVCPDASLLSALSGGTLDEGTAAQVRRHLLQCSGCSEAFYALERSRPKIVDLDLRIGAGVVHCQDPPEDLEWHLPGHEVLGTPLKIATRREMGPAKPTPVIQREALPFHVSLWLRDSEGTASAVGFQIEEDPWHDALELYVIPAEKVDWLARVRSDPVEIEKQISASEEDISLRDGTIMYSRVPLGSRQLCEIHDGEEVLGAVRFRAELFSCAEAKTAAEWNIEQGQLERAQRILQYGIERFGLKAQELVELDARVFDLMRAGL